MHPAIFSEAIFWKTSFKAVNPWIMFRKHLTLSGAAEELKMPPETSEGVRVHFVSQPGVTEHCRGAKSRRGLVAQQVRKTVLAAKPASGSSFRETALFLQDLSKLGPPRSPLRRVLPADSPSHPHADEAGFSVRLQQNKSDPHSRPRVFVTVGACDGTRSTPPPTLAGPAAQSQSWRAAPHRAQRFPAPHPPGRHVLCPPAFRSASDASRVCEAPPARRCLQTPTERASERARVCNKLEAFISQVFQMLYRK